MPLPASLPHPPSARPTARLARLAGPALVGAVLFAQAGAAQAVVVRLGVGTRVATAPLQVAASRGYFEREGVEVALTLVPDERDRIEGLAEDELDLATLSADQLLLADRAGLELRGVYVLGLSGAADALLARAEVNDTRRLQGRRVAVAPASPGELLLRRALQRKGRRLGDVEAVPLAGPAAALALLDGEVDAAALQGTDLAAVELALSAADAASPGAFRTLASGAGEAGLISDLLVGEEGSVAEDKEAVKGVIRALERAIGWMRRHPEETIALLAETLPPTAIDGIATPGPDTSAATAEGAGPSAPPAAPPAAPSVVAEPAAAPTAEAPAPSPAARALAEAVWSRALAGTTLLDVAENMALLRGDFQKAFSAMSEVLDAGTGERRREVPSANRYLALSALRQVAAGR